MDRSELTAKNRISQYAARQKLSKTTFKDKCGQRCPICKHPQRKKIDKAFLLGMAIDEIINIYGSNGQGTFSRDGLLGHAKRTGLMQQFLDDVEMQAYKVYSDIDTTKAATRTEFLEAQKHRARIRKIGGYAPANQQPPTTNLTQINIEIKAMSDDELHKLIEAKSLLDGKIEQAEVEE